MLTSLQRLCMIHCVEQLCCGWGKFFLRKVTSKRSYNTSQTCVQPHRRKRGNFTSSCFRRVCWRSCIAAPLRCHFLNKDLYIRDNEPLEGYTSHYYTCQNLNRSFFVTEVSVVVGSFELLPIRRIESMLQPACLRMGAMFHS